MKTIILKSDGKEYHAALNLNAITAYSKTRGLKSINSFMKDLDFADAEDLSFEEMDRISLVFLSAISEGQRILRKPINLTIEDARIIMMENMSRMKELLDMMNVGPQMPSPRKTRQKK